MHFKSNEFAVEVKKSLKRFTYTKTISVYLYHPYNKTEKYFFPKENIKI